MMRAALNRPFCIARFLIEIRDLAINSFLTLTQLEELLLSIMAP